MNYYECGACGSLFADPEFLAGIDSACIDNYRNEYWEEELIAARERSFGSSPHRVAETFLYCRIPIERFIDIGSGPGYLLDSLSLLMPASRRMFYAVEKFPPEEKYRTSSPNFIVGSIEDVPLAFEAGSCIEVVEHLTPAALRDLLRQLAAKSVPGATYYFSTDLPEYVKKEDPDYLDPYRRGHIVSYSIGALTEIFAAYGFNVIPLPGRNWAFLAEFGPRGACTADDLLNRIWSALPENVSRLKDPELGPLMYTMGVESGRCYLEHAICESRTAWALSLDAQLKTATRNDSGAARPS